MSGNDKKLAYKASYPPEEFYCACITPEWLPSLEAVKEAKEKYLQEHTHDQNGHPSSHLLLLTPQTRTRKCPLMCHAQHLRRTEQSMSN